MKRHTFLNLLSADLTFWITGFLFFIIFLLAMLSYNLSSQLTAAWLAFWVWLLEFISVFSMKGISQCLSLLLFIFSYRVHSTNGVLWSLCILPATKLPKCLQPFFVCLKQIPSEQSRPILSSIMQQPTFLFLQYVHVSMVKRTLSFLVVYQLWMV